MNKSIFFCVKCIEMSRQGVQGTYIDRCKMINSNKIIEICMKKNLQHLPAFKQLISAEENNLKEDAERIGNNLIEFLKEQDLWRNSSAPPLRLSSIPPTNERTTTTIPPTRISSIPPNKIK